MDSDFKKKHMTRISKTFSSKYGRTPRPSRESRNSIESWASQDIQSVRTPSLQSTASAQSKPSVKIVMPDRQTPRESRASMKFSVAPQKLSVDEQPIDNDPFKLPTLE